MARVASEKVEEAKERAAARKASMKRTEEQIVALENSTLQSFKLMANGLGFDVHFMVPLTEKDKLPALTEALQKMVTVKVTRHRRAPRDSK